MEDNKKVEDENTPVFQIQRIYIKDISFEAPLAPEIFQKDWKPDVKFDVNSSSNSLSNDLYEVVLSLTVTAKIEDNVAFICEVKQAGIFHIKNLPEEAMSHAKGAGCPNILFPYARETITALVTKGTFPPLYVAPINFDAVYAQQIEKKKVTEH